MENQGKISSKENLKKLKKWEGNIIKAIHVDVVLKRLEIKILFAHRLYKYQAKMVQAALVTKK